MVFPGQDTIFLQTRDATLLESPINADKEFKVKGGNFLVIRECDEFICKLIIHNANADSIGQGFLPLKATVRLKDPGIEE